MEDLQKGRRIMDVGGSWVGYYLGRHKKYA